MGICNNLSIDIATTVADACGMTLDGSMASSPGMYDTSPRKPSEKIKQQRNEKKQQGSEKKQQGNKNEPHGDTRTNGYHSSMIRNYVEDNYYAYLSAFEAGYFSRIDDTYGTIGFYEIPNKALFYEKINDGGENNDMGLSSFSIDVTWWLPQGLNKKYDKLSNLYKDVDEAVALKEWEDDASSSNLAEGHGCRGDKLDQDHGSRKDAMENLDFAVDAMLWHPPAPEDDFNHSCSTNCSRDRENDHSLSSGSEVYLHQRDKSNEDHVKDIRKVIDGHFRAVIAQLLQVENIAVSGEDHKESWLEIITRLSWEAASLFKPYMSNDDRMDPRCYVKVKCLACGHKNDSTVVEGVICKKNAAHQQAKSRMNKPRILILEGALEFERFYKGERDKSLEKYLLAMAIAKIKSYHPDILLVEKSVSSLAQEHLPEMNISVIFNIKRSLLERFSRCTGAQMIPSVDHLVTPNLGHCDSFHMEEYYEEHGSAGQGGKKMTKTLMFFDGCPKLLGCTVLLKGAHGDELKKVKHVLQYGVFVAYHLNLEMLYLVDEGASLPELSPMLPITVALPYRPSSIIKCGTALPNCSVASSGRHEQNQLKETPGSGNNPEPDIASSNHHHPVMKENLLASRSPLVNGQSIVVSQTTRCISKGILCERRRSFPIDYYGNFDKPFGWFLRNKLLNLDYRGPSCGNSSNGHVHCYTHQQGSLTIAVKQQPNSYLPGEKEGNIWMWHRCLRCRRDNGLAPASRRVLMSEAAQGLSFGKLLELSFSDHAAEVRVCTCGHSLYRDCLRFYGCGRLVACFRYATIKVHSIHLPPPKLNFHYDKLESIQNVGTEEMDRWALLFTEIHNALHQLSEISGNVGFTSLIAYALASSYHHPQHGLATAEDWPESSTSLALFYSANPLVSTKVLHTTLSFSDDDGPLGKVNYTVTSYYSKQFEALRKICCPLELDVIWSLLHFKKCSAYGSKSDTFFAKSLDDQLLVKQVNETELESFIKFAPAYLKYLSECVSNGRSSCLEKILGIYQVTSKHAEGGKESKMDVIVMENLMFGHNVARLYDLKGYRRASRYKPHLFGENMMFLDRNLTRTMPISPIYVGTEDKLRLERVIWDDTCFLASADVVDYSLLVGVDEEQKGLVLGIVDFMKQYTVNNGRLSRTNVIPPKEYKQRLRKSMSTYILVP